MLSAADIIAVLYADIMRYKSEDPEWDGRDRFIMSKGHAGQLCMQHLRNAVF